MNKFEDETIDCSDVNWELVLKRLRKSKSPKIVVYGRPSGDNWLYEKFKEYNKKKDG